MPRYENATHFWQIERAGAANTVTTGKRGNKGRTATKHHPTIAKAQQFHDELVREKLRAGFALVDDPVPATAPLVEAELVVSTDVATVAELEQRVVDDPYDPEAYAVLGDLLQYQSDPRGELIALMLAAERAATSDERDRAFAAAGKYLARHASALYGDLARHVSDARIVTAPPLVWRYGFIHRVELGPKQLAILDEIYARPAGRFVAELALTADRDGAETIVAMLARLAPPALRELTLVVRGPVDVRPLWDALPDLEKLSITAREITVGAIDLPQAKRVALLAVLPNFEEIERIARAPWPSLERLELRLATSRLSSDGPAFEDIAPLLRRSDLPALAQLRLRGASYAGGILRALAASPLATQLELIDLSFGDMSPADTAALVAAAGKFPKLRELWLPMRHLRPQDRDALQPLAKLVIGDERAPRDRIEELVGLAARD